MTPTLAADHVAIPVADARATSPWPPPARAMAAWKRRLTSRGISFSEEDHGPQRSIYFRDPDQTVVEITWPPSPKLVAHTRTRGADRIVRAWIAADADIGDPKG